MFDIREGLVSLGSGSVMPPMATVFAVNIECRWEDLFVDTVSTVASELAYPCWVMDTHGVIWAGEAVDPERVRL